MPALTGGGPVSAHAVPRRASADDPSAACTSSLKSSGLPCDRVANACAAAEWIGASRTVSISSTTSSSVRPASWNARTTHHAIAAGSLQAAGGPRCRQRGGRPLGRSCSSTCAERSSSSCTSSTTNEIRVPGFLGNAAAVRLATSTGSATRCPPRSAWRRTPSKGCRWTPRDRQPARPETQPPRTSFPPAGQARTCRRPHRRGSSAPVPDSCDEPRRASSFARPTNGQPLAIAEAIMPAARLRSRYRCGGRQSGLITCPRRAGLAARPRRKNDATAVHHALAHAQPARPGCVPSTTLAAAGRHPAHGGRPGGRVARHGMRSGSASSSPPPR